MPYWCFCIMAFLEGVVAFAQQPNEIRGAYLETRSNQVFGCYCEWSGEAITAGREAILGWTISAGEYQGIDLAGVKVAAVIVGQASLSAGTGPRRNVLFFDTATARGQLQAARALLMKEYGELLGDTVGVHVVPVEFHEDSGLVHLIAGESVSVFMRKARLPEDAMMGAKLWYDPFIVLTQSTLATTLNSKYAGQDFDISWDDTDPGVKGYYGRFAVMPR